MNLYDLRNQIATIHRKTPEDFVINGVDILLPAINAARRKAESLIDFEYSSVNADLEIDGTTLLGDLGDAVLAGTTTAVLVKRIQHVMLPISGGIYLPIELLSDQSQADRLKRQLGRTNYDPGLTLADLGIGDTAPYAWQQGSVLAFGPATQFTDALVSSGFTVRLNIVRFLDDYTTEEGLDTLASTYTIVTVTATGRLTVEGTLTVGTTGSSSTTSLTVDGLVTISDATTEDFILVNGWRFLLWEAVLQTNRYWKSFAPKEEGNLDEAVIQAYATEALDELAAWNTSISQGNTDPKRNARPAQAA